MSSAITGGADVENSFQSSSPELASIQSVPSVELELEVLGEHVLDVVLAAPLRRLAALERLVGEAAVELAELRGSGFQAVKPSRPPGRATRASSAATAA